MSSSTEVEIGVWVDGCQKWVSGVSRRTTCYDLIRALLRAQSLRASDEDVISHIIVERWKKVERPLDHEQRILKVWKSWGETVHQVRFSLRRIRSNGGTPQDNNDDGEDLRRRNSSHHKTQGDDSRSPDTHDAAEGNSPDEGESSCGRSERSRRRHKMRQSRREAAACQQRTMHPLYHRTCSSPPPMLSDDSDGQTHSRPEPRRPPRDDPRYSDTMERLMRLVVAQGETIQNQLHRLNQRETQIETYEQQMHLLRVQSLGNDYLLSSYLHDQQNQPQECPGAGQGSGSHQGYPHVTDADRCVGQGEQTTSASRSHHEDLDVNNQLPNNQSNKVLMPGLPVPCEVYAKPINLQGNSNDLFVQGAETSDNVAVERPRTIRNIKENFSRNCARFSDRFVRFTNKDETISEEKSNDSGVVIGDDSLGNSEERTHSEIEDFGEEEVQERIALLSKMEEVFTRMLHEEEVIQGLSSTIEIIQTQHKQETTGLEEDLKRAAEQHSVLVAEVRANEQQIRVLDTSASQKKKLIDALLKDEVESDHETRYLQAQLDYILHLPPTAFRLPEEGDDPPLLPPPPDHPPCLVQSLLHHQPPILVHPTPAASTQFPNRSDAALPSRHSSPSHGQSPRRASPQYRTPFQQNSSTAPPPISSFVTRAPSPNILLAVTRAPSPTIVSANGAQSPIVRYANRSCSPNKRKPLQPPPYNHVRHNTNVKFTDKNLNERFHSKNSNSNNAKDIAESGGNNNNLKNLVSNSLPSLSNRTKPNSMHLNKNQSCEDDDNQSKSVSTNLIMSSQRLDNCNSNKLQQSGLSGEEGCDDMPPPLPTCPPPSVTPPVNNAMNLINDNLNNNISKLRSIINTSTESTTKRNILNSLGSKLQQSKPAVSYRSSGEDDESAHTSSVSSRSSTSSDASISNCSSTASSATNSDNYLQSASKLNKINRINNTISASRDTTGCKTNSINNDKDKLLCDHADTLKNIEPCNNNITNSNIKVCKKDPDSGDSNSDTGLSSLHSSSDEGGYSLDTLV